jgi:MATE family multidrug resistance protein
MQIFSYWCAGFFVSWSLSIGAITGTDWGAEGFWMGFVAGLSVAGILLLQRLNRVTKRAKTLNIN